MTRIFHNASARSSRRHASWCSEPTIALLAPRWQPCAPSVISLRSMRWDVEVATPTLEQLLAYDVVMAYSDGLFDEPEAVGKHAGGNGGRVGCFLATFDWQGDGGGGQASLAGSPARPIRPSPSPPQPLRHLPPGGLRQTHPLMQGVWSSPPTTEIT